MDLSQLDTIHLVTLANRVSSLVDEFHERTGADWIAMMSSMTFEHQLETIALAYFGQHERMSRDVVLWAGCVLPSGLRPD